MAGADALPVGVVRTDERGLIAHANTWFIEWVGQALDAIVGRPIADLLLPASQDLMPSAVGAGPWVMLQAGAPDRAAMVSRHRDGRGELLVISEASERYRALADLRRRYALADRTRVRLELLMDSSVAFATAVSEIRLAEVLSDASARAYGAAQSTVLLARPDGGSVVAAGQYPLAGRVAPESLVQLVTAPRRVVKAVGVEQADQEMAGLGAAMQGAGVRGFIAAPLHHEEMDFGAFVDWFHHERSFDDEAAPLAEALAGQAAQALATLRLQQRLAHAAMHDDVTRLPNRRLLEAEASRLVESSRCAALFIDLDRFKEVNDQLGHQAGDRMLRDAANRLIAGARVDDLVARYGGDEFVIICPVTGPRDAEDIAERVLRALSDDIDWPPALPPLRASIGVAIAPARGTVSADQLMRDADLAMYRAKSAGGNRVELTTSTPHGDRDCST